MNALANGDQRFLALTSSRAPGDVIEPLGNFSPVRGSSGGSTQLLSCNVTVLTLPVTTVVQCACATVVTAEWQEGCPDARERAGPVFPPPPGGGNTGPARSRASGQAGGVVQLRNLKLIYNKYFAEERVSILI